MTFAGIRIKLVLFCSEAGVNNSVRRLALFTAIHSAVSRERPLGELQLFLLEKHQHEDNRRISF